MSTSKVTRSGFRSTIRRRPGIVALVGVLIVFLTPFALFPEIMGDRGVTDAGSLRNGAALVFLTLGFVAAVSGTVSLLRRLLGRR